MWELASKWAAEEEATDMLHGRLAVLLVSGLWLDAQAVAQFGISGPYTHESLSVFLIHRKRCYLDRRWDQAQHGSLPYARTSHEPKRSTSSRNEPGE